MSNVRNLKATARALLVALQNLGRPDLAREIEQTLATADWQVTEEDIRRLNTAIGDATLGANSPQKDVKEPATEAPDLPESIRLYAPFVAAIEGHLQLLEALSALGRVSSTSDCVSALATLFVDVLGFEPKRVDATIRLGVQRTFLKLITVAEHEGFIVSVAVMNSEVPYSTPYKPIFQIYPYGLCVVINPRRAVVRLVYSHGRNPKQRELNYRTFVGAPRGRSINDNLIVWARRIDLLRPQYGDDRSTLRDRADAALSCSPADLAQRWASVPVDDWRDQDWRSLAHTESHSLVQLGASPLHWGLEAVLRDRFPMSVARGSAMLRYESYEAIELLDASRSLVATHSRKILLHLCLEHPNGERENANIIVPCVIPVANNAGEFCIEGIGYTHEPCLLPNGVLATRLLGDGDELLGDYTEAFLQPEYEDAGEDDEDQEEAEEPDGDKARVLEGASTRVLLEVSVSRKLAALSSRLWRAATADSYEGVNTVHRTLRPFSDAAGNFELYSKPFLISALTPIQMASHNRSLRYIRGATSDGLPPAWACVLASAAAPPGTWLPVSSSLLHPGGLLAVAEVGPNGEQVYSCSNGAELNDRASVARHLLPWVGITLGREALEGLQRKGIAETQEKIVLSPCTTKGIACPVCVKSEPGQCACEHADLDGEERTLFVDRTYLRQLEMGSAAARIRQTLVLELPAEGIAGAPTLLPGLLGQVVRPELLWLRAEPKTWPSSDPPQWPRAVSMLARITRTDIGEPHIVFSVPPDLCGTVVKTALESVKGALGQTVGWQAVLQTERFPSYRKALLPDGRCVRIRKMDREDAPYSIDTGKLACVMLMIGPDQAQQEDAPKDTRLFFDGKSGTCIECQGLVGTVAWIPALPDIPSDMSARCRLLDNEPVADVGRLAIQERERRWLRLAHPNVASAIEASIRLPGAQGAPWEPALGSILVDLELLGSQPFVADAAVVRGTIRPEGRREQLTDPTRTNISRGHIGARGNLGGFNCQCSCGLLSGSKFRGSTCKACSTAVQPSPAGANRWECGCGALAYSKRSSQQCEECGERPVLHHVQRETLHRIHMELPCSFIHPWRRTELAALLGLDEGELGQLVAQFGPSELLDLSTSALERAPSSALISRIQRTKDSKRLRNLHLAFYRLRRWIDGGRPSLDLRTVPIVAARFLTCGLPAGAHRVVHGRLAERYRALRHSIQQAERLESNGSPSLLLSAHLALQEALDALYGDLANEAQRVDSLAGLVQRIWPLSRASGISTAVPCLSRRGDEVFVEVKAALCDAESKNESGTRLPKRQVELFEPRRESFWSGRQAFDALTGEKLPALAGIFAGLCFQRLRQDSREILLDFGVEEEDDIAALGLREFLRELAKASASPQHLLEVLDAPLPLTLPADGELATARVRAIVNQTLPSRSVGAGIARVTLCEALTGWSRGPATAQHPLGWMRISETASLLPGWHRAIPTFRSRAWWLWPNESFVTPALSLLSEISPSPLIEQALGISTVPPRSAWWSENRVEIATETPDDSDGLVAEVVPDPAATTNVEETEGPDLALLEGEAALEPAPSVSSGQVGHVLEGPPIEAIPGSMEDLVEDARILGIPIQDWLVANGVVCARNPRRRPKARPCTICGSPPGMHQCCGKCGCTADGEDAIENSFGFRNMKRTNGEGIQMPQSWCRACRAGKSKGSTGAEERGEA